MRRFSQKDKDRLMSLSKEKLIELMEESDNYRMLYDVAYTNAFKSVEAGEMTEKQFKSMFEPLPEIETTVGEALKAHISHIKSKRSFPTLKGQAKASFKNEFNTMKQIFQIGSWPGYQTYLAEEFAFLWAVWGAYNLGELRDEKKTI